MKLPIISTVALLFAILIFTQDSSNGKNINKEGWMKKIQERSFKNGKRINLIYIFKTLDTLQCIVDEICS